jgi:hypothetical protein
MERLQLATSIARYPFPETGSLWLQEISDLDMNRFESYNYDRH